jgi:hypothetical protein
VADLTERVNRYEVCALPPGHVDWGLFVLEVVRVSEDIWGDDLHWRVTRWDENLDANGLMRQQDGYSLDPSDAHVSLDEALATARRLAPLIWYGNVEHHLTAADVLARDAARKKEETQ